LNFVCVCATTAPTTTTTITTTTLCLCRHAQDVRELYERKLERANNLYMELCACMLQMEKRERELAKSVLPAHSLICLLYRLLTYLFLCFFVHLFTHLPSSVDQTHLFVYLSSHLLHRLYILRGSLMLLL